MSLLILKGLQQLLNDSLYNRILDEKLKFVQENSSTMDSFIDNALQSLDEIRQDAVRVQQHATKYGYKIEEESTFKHLDREALEAEAVAQQRVEVHIRTMNKVFITYFVYNYVKSTR